MKEVIHTQYHSWEKKIICINEIEREITTKALDLISPFSSKPFLQSFKLVYQMLT